MAALFYKNQLGQQLQWGSWNLKDLDNRFRVLLSERKIPGLVGVEAYENKFIIRRRYLPNTTYVVSEEWAGDTLVKPSFFVTRITSAW